MSCPQEGVLSREKGAEERSRSGTGGTLSPRSGQTSHPLISFFQEGRTKAWGKGKKSYRGKKKKEGKR